MTDTNSKKWKNHFCEGRHQSKVSQFFLCFIALINIKPNEAESQSDEATGDEFS